MPQRYGGTQMRRGMNLSYVRWIEEDDGNGEQQPSLAY
jgi:hypothetical protein